MADEGVRPTLARFFSRHGGLRITRLVGLLLVALAFAPFASAEEKPKDPASVIYPRTAGNAAEPAGGRNSSYSTVLVAAVLMAGAGAWLYWRGRGEPGRAVAARKLAIAETKSLGNRQYLVVASYENKKFLLGVCPGRIDLLTPLDAPFKVEEPRS